MQNADNIEKLFREKLQHFEADVNPNIWSSVQKGINTGGSAASGTVVKLAIGKIITGVAAVGVVAGGIWYAAAGGEKKETETNSPKNKTELVHETPKNSINDKNAKENLPSGSSVKQTFSSSHSSEKNKSKKIYSRDENVVNNTIIGSNEAPENSSSDNASSMTQPKYGNATHGPGGLLREAKNTTLKINSSAGNFSNGTDADAENSAPTATIFVSTSSGDAPLAVNFMNQGTASSLQWDFGDGTTSNENFPKHIFEKAGTYEVSLTAKSSGGSATAKISIEAKPISSLGNIPNIFTPNGDGENDIFRFDLKNIANVAVVIYSIERGQVYQWNTLDGGWNGKLNDGTDAPKGLYLYSIRATGTDGIPYTQNGSVQLSR